MDSLPHISLLMPTYERLQFLPLIHMNLMFMDYPKDKLELVIFDDGDNALIPEQYWDKFEKATGINLKYKHDNSQRFSIGYKRNWLCKHCTHNIMAFMDDDDIYSPSYLAHSYNIMKTGNYGLVGSKDMICCFIKDDFLLRGFTCETKLQIHEATMMFTKKYFKAMGGFDNTSQGEGASFIRGMDEGKIGLTDIARVMICVAHSGNSVSKEDFKGDEFKLIGHHDKLEDSKLKEVLKMVDK